MSIMRCDGCENHIDTDFCVEGIFMDGGPPWYYCAKCREEKVEARDPAVLAQIKKDDPAEYADIIAEDEAETEADSRPDRHPSDSGAPPDVAKWNADNPVGTYGNLTKDSGEVCTRVTGAAYFMGGQVVAMFAGVSGCYLASRFHKDATND